MKFEIPATIVCGRGHGAWLVNIDGKHQVYNQKYIKPCFSENGLPSKTKDCYDMLEAWESTKNLPVECESMPVEHKVPRYFLRPNRKKNYRV